MADQRRYPDPHVDTGREPGVRPAPGTPGWVKALAIAAIVAILALVGVMLLAGGEHGPGRHGAAGQGTGTPAASTQQNAGAVGGPAAANEAARTVAVRALDAMAFEPSAVTVSGGETVTFAVTNAGRTVHEFTLGDAAMQQEHAAQMEHMPDGHDAPNSITLQPGETKQLTWRFGDAGTLEYACHEPGHWEAGMRGRITVS